MMFAEFIWLTLFQFITVHNILSCEFNKYVEK